ncbi:aspartate homoserine dehydrogenase ii, partial [Perilla frutescens var. frutescens]
RPTNDDRKWYNPSIQPKNRAAAAPESDTTLRTQNRLKTSCRIPKWNWNYCSLKLIWIQNIELRFGVHTGGEEKRHYLFFSQKLQIVVVPNCSILAAVAPKMASTLRVCATLFYALAK